MNNIDSINDINVLKQMLKDNMIELKVDMGHYHKGDFVFYNMDNKGITVYFDRPMEWEYYEFDEAEQYFKF